MAYQRLQNLESRMSKDNNFAAKYKFEIEKYVQKGYARLLSRDETAQTSPTTWYLPHFGVVNPHKPSKLRIVFDAAAATSNVSLNSVLLKGPEHAQSLIAVIHKFRQGSVAVAADIQEMFSQVAIRDIDQHSQRFLWRDGDRCKPVQVYVMSSMIFGAVCSPCCAEYIKNLNAKKYESTMPRGSTTVVNNMYVDDLVVSFVDAVEAEEVVSEVIAINSAAGFKLRNFVSNDKSLQAKLCGEEEALPTCVAMEHKSAADKVLGMFWNTLSDSFEFHVKFHKISRDVLNCKRPPTKRELLGIAMAIYDPFGFLADVTIYVKLLQQSLWKCQTEWDEPIPQQLNIKWMSRCYSELLLSADEIQLHVFVDASSSAYAAVAYLRIKRGSNVDVAFVAAKSRCAPVKGMTVPRLELQAAVLGSRLHKSIVDCHDIKIHHVIFWSDSKTVLLWIKSTTREYKQFVGSRIAEILSTTKSSQWRWLPTAFNVADDATRGKLVPKFDPNNRWLKGPEFLQRAEEDWPKDLSDFVPNDCAAEEKKTCLFLTSTTDEYILNFKNFSSYLKVVRVMSWVQRFIYNTRNRCRREGELKAIEIAEAERALCRRVQEECFATEIYELRLKQNASDVPQQPYRNVMYDRRVIRGSVFGTQQLLQNSDPFDKAAEIRRRHAIRKQKVCRNQRNVLGTPPPVKGRRHEVIQTEKYLEELVQRPPEFSVDTQTDLFLEKPQAPPYVPAKVGVDVATEIGDGELFHFDAEAQPIIDILVDACIEQSILEVAHEQEISALRQKQSEFIAQREAELAELRRLEAEEIRLQAEKERRLQQEAIAKELHEEMQKSVTAAKLLQGHIAGLLPEVLDNLEPATDAAKKEHLMKTVAPWLTAEVAEEVGHIVDSREILTAIIKEIIKQRATAYAGYKEDRPLETVMERGEDDVIEEVMKEEVCTCESSDISSEKTEKCGELSKNE